MKKCTNCNIDYDDTKNFCIECGTKLIVLKTEEPEQIIEHEEIPPIKKSQNHPNKKPVQKKYNVNLTIAIALVIIFLSRYLLEFPPSISMILIIIAAIIVYYQSSKNKRG